MRVPSNFLASGLSTGGTADAEAGADPVAAPGLTAASQLRIFKVPIIFLCWGVS